MENALDLRDLSERLIKLETKTCLKFEEMEKALVLARDLVRAEKENARDSVEERMEHMNQLQRKLDKQEAVYATKEDLASTNRLVYIGVGLALALQVAFGIIK